MFRMSLLSCVVLAVVALGSFAQDKKAEPTIPQINSLPNPSAPFSPFPSSKPEPVPALSAAEDEAPADESESPYYEKKKDGWTPAMRVFLNEAPGVQAIVQNKAVNRGALVTRYKSTQKNGKVIQVPVMTMQEVSQVVKSVTAGATIIDCDDVNVRVSTSEEGPKAFEFEIKGKLQLQNGSTLIEAKSGKLADGKLTLTDVTLNTDSMKMTCTELVLDLKVQALRVGEVTEPVAPMPTPAPVYSAFDTPRLEPTPAASFDNPFPVKSDSNFRKKTPDDVFRTN